MFDSELEWTESSNGNYVLRDDFDGEVLATVYRTRFGYWQIIVNGEERGRLVADETYDSPRVAMKRAKAILAGAVCDYARDTATVQTSWTKQKTIANGQPTYGRKSGRSSITVKCAVSGKWYYLIYNGPTCGKPQGWFDSAEQAMQAAERHHQSF